MEERTEGGSGNLQVSRPPPQRRYAAARGGVSFPIVASLLGWSPSTTTKMAKRYGHIGNAAHREAVAALDPAAGDQGWAQKTAQRTQQRKWRKL